MRRGARLCSHRAFLRRGAAKKTSLSVAVAEAQLPPVRVELVVREEIESCLRDGESLSQFIEKAAVEAARTRKSQEEFLARGRASLARAQRDGEFYPAADVMHGMRSRLQHCMDTLKRKSAANSP